jgi:hypothetical protein
MPSIKPLDRYSIPFFLPLLYPRTFLPWSSSYVYLPATSLCFFLSHLVYYISPPNYFLPILYVKTVPGNFLFLFDVTCRILTSCNVIYEFLLLETLIICCVCRNIRRGSAHPIAEHTIRGTVYRILRPHYHHSTPFQHNGQGTSFITE